MKINLRCVLFAMLMCVPSFNYAATYYISPMGSDTAGNGSSTNPWATLKKAFGSMAGGDTLTVKNGTYKGLDNQIYINQRPPHGNPTNWTTVKAETAGEAIFDGELIRGMFNLDYNGTSTDMYCQFEGLLWKNGTASVAITYGNYCKFIRCGNSNESIGNTATFSFGRSRYCLFENCYAYGAGRYKYLLYNSTACIVRNCVARTDRVNAPGEPLGMFMAYGAVDVEFQNCIAIDSDQDAHYTFGGELMGAFGNPVSPSAIYNTRSKFVNCVSLNNHLGGGAVDAGYEASYENCVWWEFTTMGTSNNLFNIKNSSATYRNCTFGMATNYGDTGLTFYNAVSGAVHNSIFYGFRCAGAALYSNIGASLDRDYNCFNYNLLNYSGSAGVHDITNLSPKWSTSNTNGALKSIVRIEEGSNLSGVGLDGSDIGANIATLIGTPGTLWGETGYNSDIGVPMWPFPNEALIRSKMRAYKYTDANGTINGARGFCADGQSLTKYIWGYLGNPVPSELTRALEGEVENSRGLGVTGVSMVISDGISDTASTDSSGAYAFAGLTPGSDYTIKPVKEGYTFSPPSRTVSNFSGTLTGLNFTASGLGVGDVVQPQELRVVGSVAQQGTINPTKGDTAKIYFQGTATGTYECRIFNINRVMVWQDKKEGTNMGIFEWFPKDMPSGAYIVNVQGPGFNQTKKLAVLK